MRTISFWLFPEHLHLLGSYELRGRNVEIVRRDFANVPSEDANRFPAGSTSSLRPLELGEMHRRLSGQEDGPRPL